MQLEKKQRKVYIFEVCVCASVIVYQLLVYCPECNVNNGSARNLLRYVSVLAIFVVYILKHRDDINDVIASLLTQYLCRP